MVYFCRREILASPLNVGMPPAACQVEPEVAWLFMKTAPGKARLISVGGERYVISLKRRNSCHFLWNWRRITCLFARGGLGRWKQLPWTGERQFVGALVNRGSGRWNGPPSRWFYSSTAVGSG